MEIKKDNSTIATDKEVEEGTSLFKRPLTRSVLAKKLLIRGENLRKFEDFRAKIALEVPTSTEIENILLEKVIISAWKLERAGEIERNILNKQHQIKDFDEQSGWNSKGSKRQRIRSIKKIHLFKDEIQHIIQYQNDLEKAMQKSLERLREEQKLSAKNDPIHKDNKK